MSTATETNLLTRDRHRWSELKEILADALEVETDAARDAFLRRACQGDAELLREAQHLLGTETEEFETFAQVATDNLREDRTTLLGQRIGPYLVVRELGRGGMGAVYLGERADGQFRKAVAIKVLKRSAETQEILRRFKIEREILARLEHPNITRLLDAGTTDDGLSYFVMELSDGVPITTYAESHLLPLRARLRLFWKVCAAVEYAHQHGVVHRDLKPTNILVNAEGEPKLLDFGIAKRLSDLRDSVEQTGRGEERLTPFFASPEQVQGKPLTASTDLYSLAVVLYRLLTHSVPFVFPTGCPSRAQFLKAICDQPPRKPSLAATDATSRRQLRGDLDAIILRALEKDPAARYPSVTEFADDLERFLNRQPVEPRSGEIRFRITRDELWKARRRRFLILVGGGALFTLLALYASGVFDQRRRSSLGGNLRLGTESSTAPTRDTAAYELYLRGHTAFLKRDMRKSIDLLEQAIARDAGFTEAYCLLAKVNLFSYRFVSREPAHLRAGKAAAEKAMQLAPNLPESHIALARYYYLGLQDYYRTYAELAQVTSPGNRSEYVDFLALTERRMGRWVDAVRHSEQAYELDPRNHFIAIALLESYLALRQYEQAIRFADRALTELPPDDDIIHIYKASALIGMGKLDEARMLLEQAPTRTPDGTAKLIQLAILARDLDRASELWATFPPARRFEVLYEGEIAELRGDTEKAHSFYRDARQHYLKLLEDNPDDRELTSFLSAAEAGLGNKAEAFRLARRAVELRPIFRDTYEAPAFALTRAEIYAWMGEGQAALDLLEELVTIPGSVSYGSLRFDPVWDDIRGDARFQALMARVTQPPVYR